MESVNKPTYPRITKSYAKSLIAQDQLVIAADMAMVIYMVKLTSGHRLLTDAIVANHAAFDPEKGTQIAKDKMLDKIMELEMYRLRAHLHTERQKESTNAE